MMKCITGKNCYSSESIAQEALIQHYIRKDHRTGSGPINIYECSDCGDWHFTSKGDIAAFLKDQDVKERIEKERRASDWEKRL